MRSVAGGIDESDSTVCEVHGKAKHGAAYGHTGVLGYHPLGGHKRRTRHCQTR